MVAPADSRIQADIVTTSTYPRVAIVLAPDGQNGLRRRTLRGQHVRGTGTGAGPPNAYRYRFTTGAYRGRGYALLSFVIARHAPLGTVVVPITAREPGGCVSTLTGAKAPRFQVVRDDASSPDDDGRLLINVNRMSPGHRAARLPASIAVTTAQ